MIKKRDAKKTTFLKKKFLGSHLKVHMVLQVGIHVQKAVQVFILKIRLERHDKPLLPNHSVFNQMEAAALSQNTYHSAIIATITWSQQTSARVTTSAYITITVSPPSFRTTIIIL